MNIVEKTENGVKFLILSGHLDGQTAGEVEASLMVHLDSADKLILDFSDVAFVSSAGLRVVLIGAKKMAARKAQYGLCGLKPEVMAVFKMSGFAKIMQIFDDQAASLAGMQC